MLRFLKTLMSLVFLVVDRSADRYGILLLLNSGEDNGGRRNDLRGLHEIRLGSAEGPSAWDSLGGFPCQHPGKNKF